jgi:hypothetical protein
LNRSLHWISCSLYLILMMTLISCCKKTDLLANGGGEAAHERLIGYWRLIKRIQTNDAAKPESVTDYSNAICPSILKISADTLTRLDIISNINSLGKSNCYFKMDSHYAFRPDVGLVRVADTLGASFAHDTLLLFQKLIVRSQPTTMQVSVYAKFTGLPPPAGTACNCGDSIFSAHSR